MDNIYYAHSGHDPQKTDWQRLADHLTRVASLAGENARYFGAEQLYRLLAQVCVQHICVKTDEQLIEWLSDSRQILVIFNHFHHARNTLTRCSMNHEIVRSVG